VILDGITIAGLGIIDVTALAARHNPAFKAFKKLHMLVGRLPRGAL
jgi:endonuclease V-like protein UPF0215 family